LPADASPAAQADAHACLLDALKLPEVAILGGSAGAPSAIEFCLRHAGRCSAMVLLVPAFFPPGALPVRAQPSFMFESVLGSDFFFWLNMKVARDAMLEKVFAIPVRDFENASAGEQERILRIARGILPLSLRRKGLWNDLAIVASSPRYELERIASPALVIGIEDDLFGTKWGRCVPVAHRRQAYGNHVPDLFDLSSLTKQSSKFFRNNVITRIERSFVR